MTALPIPAGTSPAFTDLPDISAVNGWSCSKKPFQKLLVSQSFTNPSNPRNMFELKEVLPVAARALKLTIQRREVRDADDFERVFAAINKQRPDGLYVPGEPANEC